MGFTAVIIITVEAMYTFVVSIVAALFISIRRQGIFSDAFASKQWQLHTCKKHRICYR
jgi:hypothetical protein